MTTTKELLGRRIRELRKARGLSQERLAEQIDIEPRNLTRIESGKGYPTFDRLDAIGKALGVELKAFFQFDHLQNVDERTEEIVEMVRRLSERDQRRIFKMIRIMLDDETA